MKAWAQTTEGGDTPAPEEPAGGDTGSDSSVTIEVPATSGGDQPSAFGSEVAIVLAVVLLIGVLVGALVVRYRRG